MMTTWNFSAYFTFPEVAGIGDIGELSAFLMVQWNPFTLCVGVGLDIGPFFGIEAEGHVRLCVGVQGLIIKFEGKADLVILGFWCHVRVLIDSEKGIEFEGNINLPFPFSNKSWCSGSGVASHMVTKCVAPTDEGFQLGSAGERVQLNYELDENAESVKFEIRDVYGGLQRTATLTSDDVGGPILAGEKTWDYDSTTDGGSDLPAGKYTYVVTATGAGTGQLSDQCITDNCAGLSGDDLQACTENLSQCEGMIGDALNNCLITHPYSDNPSGNEGCVTKHVTIVMANATTTAGFCFEDFDDEYYDQCSFVRLSGYYYYTTGEFELKGQGSLGLLGHNLAQLTAVIKNADGESGFWFDFELSIFGQTIKFHGELWWQPSFKFKFTAEIELSLLGIKIDLDVTFASNGFWLKAEVNFFGILKGGFSMSIDGDAGTWSIACWLSFELLGWKAASVYIGAAGNLGISFITEFTLLVKLKLPLVGDLEFGGTIKLGGVNIELGPWSINFLGIWNLKKMYFKLNSTDGMVLQLEMTFFWGLITVDFDGWVKPNLTFWLEGSISISAYGCSLSFSFGIGNPFKVKVSVSLKIGSLISISASLTIGAPDSCFIDWSKRIGADSICMPEICVKIGYVCVKYLGCACPICGCVGGWCLPLPYCDVYLKWCSLIPDIGISLLLACFWFRVHKCGNCRRADQGQDWPEVSVRAQL